MQHWQGGTNKQARAAEDARLSAPGQPDVRKRILQLIKCLHQ
ncbi:hypothetical protein [Chitinophaga qingshengii]|nr:hypothetical protein [Chitinophaga qingshengii]